MRFTILVISLLCFFGVPLLVFAQEGSPQAIDQQTQQPETLNEADFVLGEAATPKAVQVPVLTSMGATVRAFFVLALVLGLAYLFLRFLRKISGQEGGESSAIKIMASQTLKGQAGLYIVEIAHKVYILGVADTVNLISEITDKEVVDELRLQSSQQAPKQTFGQMFRGKLALQGVDPKVKTVLNTERQTDRLRQLLPKKDDIDRERGPHA